jgi:hypothetical protein
VQGFSTLLLSLDLEFSLIFGLDEESAGEGTTSADKHATAEDLNVGNGDA